jgi:integrase/recombinase XerD
VNTKPDISISNDVAIAPHAPVVGAERCSEGAALAVSQVGAETRVVTSAAPGTHAAIESLTNPYRVEDERFVWSWLSGKSKETRRHYRRTADELLANLHPRTLRDARLEDLQIFVSFYSSKRAETERLRVAIVKSLFSFGVKTGYLKANLAALLKLRPQQSDLNRRYLPEEETHALLLAVQDPRNRVLLKVLYYGGVRVSEAASLSWADTQARSEGQGQISINGKGSRRRVVLLPASVFSELLALRQGRGPSEPVFVSREGGRLSVRMIREIVRSSAYLAGIAKRVSPHWLRHAHASHALDNGAPIHLLKDTLGHESLATTTKYLHSRPGESSGKYLKE